MNRHTDFGFLKHFASTMLVALGLAASAAQADPSDSVSVAATTAVPESERQCTAPAIAPSEGRALARFETGTTFLLTDKGLTVLKRPKAKKWYSVIKSAEPEYLNTGN